MSDSQDDRAAVLRRRNRFVASAIAGLTLPVASASCDPRPCLEAPPVEVTEAPSSSASAPATPSASTASEGTPSKEVVVSRAEAEKLGLPSIGFRVSMTRGGWSIEAPTKGSYLRASGPPGGPLAFIVKPYHDGVSDMAVMEVLFRTALSDRGGADGSGLDPIVSGPSERLAIGGVDLEAQAFRTGRSAATTQWCAVKVPAGAGSRIGALLLLGQGASGAGAPSCKAVLEHPALQEIVATLAWSDGAR